MALNVLLLLLTGLFLVGALPASIRIYHLVSMPSSWGDAQSYCRMNYNDLASAVTPEEWARLDIKVGGLSQPVWLGLSTDVDDWRWSYGNVPLKVTAYNKWSSYNTMKEKCGVIYEDGHWEDYSCIDVNPIICYDASLTGPARFVAVGKPFVTWPVAQAYCRTFHTDMATVSNDQENNLAMMIAQQQTWSWLGLYKSEEWHWSNGNNATGLTWQTNAPDNAVPPENCATYLAGQLTDEQCSKTNYFICDSFVVPRKRQKVKLWLSSNGTMFDQASEEAILNLVKMKLMEHGIWENITLSWKLSSSALDTI